MRIRTIKPELWVNEKLATVSEPALLLAAALLNYADDDGYFNAHTGLLQHALFPLRQLSVPIQQALEELVGIDYIRLYPGVDGRTYGHVVSFLVHQRIDHPSKSKIRPLLNGAVKEEPMRAARSDEMPGTDDPPEKEARRKRPTSSPQGKLLRVFQEVHLLKRKQPYGLTAYIRDAALMAKCAAEFGEEETEARIRRFFGRAGDKFLEKAGFTVPIFVSQINNLGKSPGAPGYPINRVI